MNSIKPPIYLAAAGHGTRMRGAIDAMGYPDLPKHLLPTGDPSGETLLGRNLRLAQATGHATVLLANGRNVNQLTQHPDIDLTDTAVVVDPPVILGPFSFYSHATAMGHPESMSAAGDVYISNLNWSAFLQHHQQSSRPVTFMVGQVAAPKDSAVFIVNDRSEIDGFSRLTQEQPDAYRNVGVYAITKTAAVEAVFANYEQASDVGLQDQIALDLIHEGLASAYVHPDGFSNINSPADYYALLGNTTQSALVG